MATNPPVSLGAGLGLTHLRRRDVLIVGAVGAAVVSHRRDGRAERCRPVSTARSAS
jgi:hypothetical protein